MGFRRRLVAVSPLAVERSAVDLRAEIRVELLAALKNASPGPALIEVLNLVEEP